MSKQKTPVDQKPHAKRLEDKSPSPDVFDGTREKLRELDNVDVELGDRYFDRLHDQIMARIEKITEIPETTRRRNARAKLQDKMINLIQKNL